MVKSNSALAFLVVAASFFSLNAQPVFSQSAEDVKSLKEEIKALKEGQSAIQKDLQEIKTLLRTRLAQPQAAPEFKEAVLAVDSGHVRRDNNAKLVLIEFSDYQ